MRKYHLTATRTERYAASVAVMAESEIDAHDQLRNAMDAGEFEVEEDDYSGGDLEIDVEPYDPRWHDDETLGEAVERQRKSRKQARANEDLDGYALTLEDRLPKGVAPTVAEMREMALELRKRVELEWGRQADAVMAEWLRSMGGAN